MPRSVANKNYRTFVQGMITEASPLTYPENASVSEDNCVLFRKGNRTRRLGFEAESGSSLSSFSLLNDVNLFINEFSWEAVDERGEKDFYVYRAGNMVYFFEANTDPLSSGLESFTIDLTNYLSETSFSAVASSRVSFSAGRGYLFMVGEQIKPLLVEYDSASEAFSVREIKIRIRDFVGVDDGLANDFEPTTLSDEHHYNLRNQGWVAPSSKIGNTTGSVETDDVEYQTVLFTVAGRFNNTAVSASSSSNPITQYKAQIGLYPANNKAWWVGKLEVADPDKGLEAGDFDPDILCNTFTGNTLAARGHFILEAFNRDRSDVGGVPNIPTETKTTRPSAVGFFSGRVWYGHESDVYYSQTLQDYRQAGNCFQEADPTSEEISDLIATDGGLIPIPEAFNIKAMHPIGGSLLVFAENGVWAVSGGGNNGFSALDISVSKVSSNGMLSPDSLVDVGGSIYWWAPSGIMSLSQKSGLFGAQEGVFDRENVTEATIQSFYNNDIPREAKKRAKGYYDPSRNLVQWLFNDGSTPYKSFYNRILNLDESLKAFYPWSISSDTGKALTGCFIRPTVKQIRSEAIFSNNGEEVINSFLQYHYACLQGTSYKMGFGDFQSSSFLDFGNDKYLSFMETGYELLEDLMRNKQSNYVFLYFRRTDDEDEGVDSSCFFQTKWDWGRSENSNRWSRKVEGYRKTARFDDSYIVSTKHKARGHGRTLQVRFESSEASKTFDLLGWATSFSGNTTV